MKESCSIVSYCSISSSLWSHEQWYGANIWTYYGDMMRPNTFLWSQSKAYEKKLLKLVPIQSTFFHFQSTSFLGTCFEVAKVIWAWNDHIMRPSTFLWNQSKAKVTSKPKFVPLYVSRANLYDMLKEVVLYSAGSICHLKLSMRL